MPSAHHHFASYCFNQAWNLIDKPDRSPQENEEMINLSHASLWHWTMREDFNAEKASIAYWQLARIYTILGQTHNANRYAGLCLQASQDEGVSPLLLGYAYEALARAESSAGNHRQAETHLQTARDIAERIVDPQERKYLLDDLETIR